jgi:hypothetical protein
MSSNKQSGIEIALANEVEVLKGLQKFGWLRSKDIASLIWQKKDKRFSNREPEFCKPISSPSGLRMAQITLKRLKYKKLILSATTPDNSTIYALSQKGANHLNAVGIDTGSGKDLLRFFSFDQYRHRVISNELSISGILQGFKVFTEREIAQNNWHFNKTGFLGKKPDCLIQNKEYSWWVEVERSRKNQKDYAFLLKWLNAVFENCKRPHEKPALTKSLSLQKVVFICTPVFENRLIADLNKLGWCEEQVYLRLIFHRSLYSFRQACFFS